MNELFLWLTIAATVGGFCGAAMRLLDLKHPHPTIGCRAHWVLWGAVHIGIALACIGYLVDALTHHSDTQWHTVLIRVSVAVLLLAPWDQRCLRK